MTIIAVGDIMMGTTYPSNNLPPEDGKEMFAGVQEKLKTGSLSKAQHTGNLLNYFVT